MPVTQTAATALATGGTSTLTLKTRPDATSTTFYCSSAGAGSYLYADYTMDGSVWLPMTVQDSLGANLTQPTGLTGNAQTTYTATLPVGTQYVRLTAQTATASTWQITAGSMCNVDTAASAVSGGTKLWAGYVNGTSATTRGVLSDLIGAVLQMGNNAAGTTGDILTIAARSLSGNQATTAVIRCMEHK